jgi:hypothetical protein
MNVIQNLIKAADQARKEKSFHSHSSTIIENIGEVICFRDYGVYKNGYPSTTKSNFKLNGKVISVANLTKLLK